MASQPVVVLRAAVTVAALSVSSVSLPAADLRPTAGPDAAPVSVGEPHLAIFQHAQPKGPSSFAFALQGEAAKVENSHVRQHVILLDTSASQAGTYRKRALSLIN